MMKPFELEVCVDSAAALSSCFKAGVDRVELCSALALGGLTPAYGLMKMAGRLQARARGACFENDVQEVFAYGDTSSATMTLAMIRPRAGNFCFSESEIQSMCDDIAAVREAGLSGVVLGAATPDGCLDLSVLGRLCQAAGDLQKTLHRVVDLLDDPLQAIDQAIDLGFTRILTSGGAPAVSDGMARLAHMQRYAGDRIQIMAGAGMTPTLARAIYAQAGISAFHASCRRSGKTDPLLDAFGFAGPTSELDTGLIEEYRRAFTAISGSV